MSLVPDDAWAKCLSALKGKLFSQSYDTWLRPLVCTRFDTSAVVLEAPHSFSISWIKEHYLKEIRQVIRQLFNLTPEVEFVVNGADQSSGAAPVSASGTAEQTTLWQLPQKTPAAPLKPLAQVGPLPNVAGSDGFSLPVMLNPEYTFESFVVSSTNEVAHSAAKTVADSPGRTPFNPLLIYGGVGLGKTHLLQAVAAQCLQQGTAKKPLYVTSEQFARDFVTSLKEHQTLQFAKMYRQADVLLLDDIQFFEGKERMQEEFFHTFNTLHNQGKQIVLSSDRPPEALGGLQDRLLSRIQWGLVADIQSPDLETRIAICQVKAESRGLVLTDGVAEFIANQVHSNIRELEGIIKRLLFLVENLHTKLTLDVVENAVRTMQVSAPDQVTLARIQEAVASHYHLPLVALVGKSRRSDLVTKRQLAMYLCKMLTGDSLRAIGAAFGGRNHATVMHSCRMFEERLSEDPSLLADYTAVLSALGYSPNSFRANGS